MKTLAPLLILIPILLLAQDQQLTEADRLFADRDQPASLKKAAELLQQILQQQAANYEANWRLARVDYYESDRVSGKDARLQLLRSGEDAARKAIQADPGKVEGHFWLASNVGGAADLQGAFKSMSAIKTIRREFEEAFRIDPKFDNCACYQALGELDYRVPSVLGGHHDRGVKLLQDGAAACLNNAELKLTLAEVLIDRGHKDEARPLIESVLNTADPLRTSQERADIRNKATRLLSEKSHPPR